MTIKTDKLILENITQNDAENLLALRTNPEVNQYIGRNVNQTIKDIEFFIEDVNKRRNYFKISTLDSNEFVGTICLWNINQEEKYAEIGYELFPHFQNKGLMTNAIIAVLNYAFNELNFETIEAKTHKDNLNSRKLLAKTGFKILENKVDPNVADNVVYEIKKINISSI